MRDHPEEPSNPAQERPWESMLYDPDPSTCDSRPPTCSVEGVDLSLICWFLGLTPAARLATLQSAVDLVYEARNARPAHQVCRTAPRS